MAPSIYEYQSEADWQTAMNEWCAENEPQDTNNETSTLNPIAL